MLRNKTIFITGSSRGIGAATARLAKQYGAKVILHGKDKSESLEKLAQELGTKYYPCDVIDSKMVQQTVNNAIGDYGKIDALINCAGIALRTTIMDNSDEPWLDMFKINILGTLHFCQAVFPHMQKAGSGRIVNTSSIRGFTATAGKPAYSVSKAGIVNLTATMAKEFAPFITVNAVAPGFTETDMSKTWDEPTRKLAESCLLKRTADPKEIAEALLFLASDRASFITGQTFLVDGGYSISNK